MSLASVAIKSARVYLNDTNGITWSDTVLFPLLQEAHYELVQELELHNTGNLKVQTSPITVPAGALTLGVSQPTGLLNPISIQEGDPGTDPNSFQDMVKVTFLPLIDQSNWLGYWAWIGQVITFIGATADRQIILRYEGNVETPKVLTDPLACIFADRYMGPRIASLAYTTIGKDNTTLQAIADRNLHKLIQSLVVNDQRPHSRRAYRSDKGFYGPTGISVPVGQITSPGISINWITTVTPPDGIRTTFLFPQIPKYVSWNGLNQFLSTGYTLTFNGTYYVVTFIDINNAVLTPNIGDIIREETL